MFSITWSKPFEMKNYSNSLVLFLFLVPVFSMYAQIRDVCIEYEINDLSTYQVIFSSTCDSKNFFSLPDTAFYSFEWQFGDGRTGNMPIVLHRYASAGTYAVTLTVTELNDPWQTFTNTRSVTISDSFEVPNVFTPDGDGINDNFIVRSNGATPLDITIFDRTGNIVYKHTSPVINWDGRTPAGARVRPGVYYYVISSSDPIYNKTGFIRVFYNK
jgi:gliding motility-associated-like protein